MQSIFFTQDEASSPHGAWRSSIISKKTCTMGLNHILSHIPTFKHHFIKQWRKAKSFPYLKPFLPSIPGFYICGHWCTKLYTFLLLLDLRALLDISEFFRINQNHFLWVPSIFLLLNLIALIDFFSEFLQIFRIYHVY